MVGSIEKTFEIQAHSRGVEKLKISYDNNWLFSTSAEGTLCIFNIVERNLKAKGKSDIISQFTQELLIQKSQRDNVVQKIETLY